MAGCTSDHEASRPLSSASADKRDTKNLVSFLPSDRDVIGKLEIREIGAHLNATTRTQLVQAQFDICS